MSTKRILHVILILSILIVNIGCDQISKRIVRNKISPYETIQLLSNHVIITHVENSGAFLSLGNSLPKSAKNILLSLLPLTAVALGFIYILSRPAISNSILAGLCFVVGGGMGNIFDRVMYGSVTDFLHINFGFFQTGIFNMADVSIMAGVFIILIQSFYKRKFTQSD